MKPNLIVVQPPHFHLDSIVEHFCEDLCDSHYVYLVRPDSEFRDDSEAGVRFLGHSLDSLPRFGSVEVVIAIADPALVELLKECYPESSLAVWDPGEDSEIPARIASLLRPTVVRGEFGIFNDPLLAKAM